MASQGDGRSSPVGMPSIADRLNTLFARIGQQDRYGGMREFTTRHVAKTITEDSSHTISMSRTHLHHLRTGESSNPTTQTLAAIAKFFHDHRPAGMAPITITYFFQPDDDPVSEPTGVTEADEERAFREKLAEHKIQHVAMRGAEMTPAARRQILALLDILVAGRATTDDDHPPQ